DGAPVPGRSPVVVTDVDRIGRVGAVRQRDRLPRAGGATVAVVGGADLPAVGQRSRRAQDGPLVSVLPRQGNPTVQALARPMGQVGRPTGQVGRPTDLDGPWV